MKTLTLVIKQKWFDMIMSGEKTSEYRELTPYNAKTDFVLYKSDRKIYF